MSVHEAGGRAVAVAALLYAFDDYLADVRGASAATRDCYARHVKVFLDACVCAGDGVELEGLSAVAVRDYVTGLADRYAPDSVKLIATAVRCFLRFVWISGHSQRDLSGAVGVVVVHRFGRLPRALTSAQVRRLLEMPDRSTPTGARDYAVLLLLSRLGLRANEVAALRLADLDWRAGQMAVRVKGGRILRLPIPHDAGEAVVEYLRTRPRSGHREVFLRVRGVPVPLTRGAVTQVVQRCAERAGLGLVHAHRLRHTLARQILDAGGSLTEVGQLLGHSTEQVTMMYSSMDLESLRPLVRAWPGGGGDA